MECNLVFIGNPCEYGWHKHQCLRCGRIFPPSPKPPKSKCKPNGVYEIIDSYKQLSHQPTCKFLGKLVRNIQDGLLDCQAKSVCLYYCGFFQKYVSINKIGHTKTLNALLEVENEFVGHSCDMCDKIELSLESSNLDTEINKLKKQMVEL